MTGGGKAGISRTCPRTTSAQPSSRVPCVPPCRSAINTSGFTRSSLSGGLGNRPGERASYGLAGYIVLSHIMEKVSGQTFPELLRSRLVGAVQERGGRV